MSKKIILLFAFLYAVTGYGQDYMLPLYAGKIPNSIREATPDIVTKEDIILYRKVQQPDIAVYLPSKRFATGQAVVICPGGGYWVLAYDLEGTDIARFLNSIGVAAIVLKYRLPTNENCVEPHKVPLMDAQRAMRLVRTNASKWNIHPDKIGIMGFSAGGHLASTLGTHFDLGNKTATDTIEQRSCRPDFMVLMYPVITFTQPISHAGSGEAFLGKNPSSDLVKYYSNEFQVKDNTPPAFLVHADDDSGVPVENSLLMYAALRKKKIPAELHVLSEGDHGFGLGINNEHVASWTNNFKLWLKWLNKK